MFNFKLFFLSISVILVAANPSQAQVFEEQKLDPSEIIAVAVPFNFGRFYPVIIEQKSAFRPCWTETSNSVAVKMDLLDFDFTGICGRAVDNNGMTIRIGNQDMNWRYSLDIRNVDGELWLLGVSVDPNAPNLAIGKIVAPVQGTYNKIVLEYGWSLTKRIYQGEVLEHYYFSYNP